MVYLGPHKTKHGETRQGKASHFISQIRQEGCPLFLNEYCIYINPCISYHQLKSINQNQNIPDSKVHGPNRIDRTQVGPMLAPWILLSGMMPQVDLGRLELYFCSSEYKIRYMDNNFKYYTWDLLAFVHWSVETLKLLLAMW